MGTTVSPPIILSGENEVSAVKDRGDISGKINDIISNLSEIIFQMNILFKKMRDMLNTYNQKQQELGWGIQVSSMHNKREAIDKTAAGAIASGVCTILSGVVSGMGAGASFKVGEIGVHAGTALGQLGSGSGKLVEGDMARNAELLRMTSELQSSGAQSYNKNIDEVVDKVNESRKNMKDLGDTINNMIGQISMAVKL